MLKLILPIGEVPENTTVTKPAGNALFTVKSTITVYRENAEKQEIAAGEGCAFLFSPHGHISAVTDDTRVAISFSSPQEAIEFLQTLIPENGQ